MRENIKQMKRQLMNLATEFYNESGARALDIVIRVTPWETTDKIVLEYADEHNNDAAKAPGGHY